MVYANVLGKQGQTMAQANMPNIFLLDEYRVFAIAAIPDSETTFTNTIKPFFSIRVIIFPPKCRVSSKLFASKFGAAYV